MQSLESGLGFSTGSSSSSSSSWVWLSGAKCTPTRLPLALVFTCRRIAYRIRQGWHAKMGGKTTKSKGHNLQCTCSSAKLSDRLSLAQLLTWPPV